MVTRQRLRCPRGSCHQARGRGPSNCTGGFYLGYDGQFTSKIAWNATKEFVEKALSALSTFNEDSDYGPLQVKCYWIKYSMQLRRKVLHELDRGI